VVADLLRGVDGAAVVDERGGMVAGVLAHPAGELAVLGGESHESLPDGPPRIAGEAFDQVELGEHRAEYVPRSDDVLGLALLREDSGEVLDDGGVDSPRLLDHRGQPVERVVGGGRGRQLRAE
jgi:hypothetical protein